MADPADALATALHELRERLGESAFDDKRRVISILSDKVADARKEIRAVATAIDEGVPGALAGSPRQYAGWEMDRQADRLEAGTGLNLELARRTVRALGHALDLGPLPSAYPAGPITSASAGPPEPVKQLPATGEWLGDPSAPAPPTPPPSRREPTEPVAPQPSPLTDHPGVSPLNGPNISSGWPQTTGGTAPGPNWAQPTVYVTSPPANGANKVLIAVIFALVAFISIAGWIGMRDDKEQPKPPGPIGPSGLITPATPPVQGAPGIGTPIDHSAGNGPADESRDFGVNARDTLQDRDLMNTPTPVSNPAAITITTAQLKQMLDQPAKPQLIDVWYRNTNDTRTLFTIPGALGWAGLGAPGSLNDDVQQKIAAALGSLASQPGRPLVFFCASVNCWESYNALIRANAAGARDLYWYRGGMNAWVSTGSATQPIPAPPMQAPNNDASDGPSKEPIDGD